MPQPVQNTPLVLAVTGHRNIDPNDTGLRSLVETECKRLGEQYADRRFVIISPLAEGADRLVAVAAKEALDARLIVPLPLPLDDPDGYEKDFPVTIDEFRTLLAGADVVFDAPMLSGDGAWRGHGDARNDQYAWVGAYSVEHAEVLFAIWDGEQARGTGGTAEVVQWFLDAHVPPGHSTLSRPGSADPLPPARPAHLIHINPQTRAVKRIAVAGGT